MGAMSSVRPDAGVRSSDRGRDLMRAELTLGAEEELHLVDLRTLHLSDRAADLLTELPPDGFDAELQRTTVETNTAVASGLEELGRHLRDRRRQLVSVAESHGLGVAAVGTLPRSVDAEFSLTGTARFQRMHELYRTLVDEQLICATQIHVGIADRDRAVEIAQRVSPVLPVFVALSASSPFWNGHDTGYVSFRTLVWQRWPTAGPMGQLASAAEYDALVAALVASGVITDAKMAYFEVRPSSHAPTLELRVCDAMPLVDDAVLIAGLFRAAVLRAEQEIKAGCPATARRCGRPPAPDSAPRCSRRARWRLRYRRGWPRRVSPISCARNWRHWATGIWSPTRSGVCSRQATRRTGSAQCSPRLGATSTLRCVRSSPRPGRVSPHERPAGAPRRRRYGGGMSQELTPEELEYLQRIFEHARNGDEAGVTAALDAGVPVDLTNSSGDTLLILAAYHRHEAIVSLLLARGADHARANDRGQTALAAAVFRRDADIVRLLLGAGAHPDAGPQSARAVAQFFDLEEMAALLQR
jgi:YbdK family carboxylate-amine ligase